MIRAILRNVQVGLIISASLLVVLAFQRLSLYSVPVLVGNIVHPGQPPSGDSKELVGHGHAHGQHRIFSTNVIEVGLFKFVVPFRWRREEDIEEEAARGESTITKRRNRLSRKKIGQSDNTIRRSSNGRAGRNKPREPVQSSDDVEGDKSHMLRASPPRLKQKLKRNIPQQDRTDSEKQNDNENEPKPHPGQARNESEADDPLLLLHFRPGLNETLIQSNVTALQARRLLKEEKMSTAWRLSSWLTRKGAKQGR